MEGQKTRVKNEIGETREQSSLQMFCFDTFNSGYSFSSNFILLLTKTVSAKKWHYEHLRISVKCFYQSSHVWGESCGSWDCSKAWGQPANRDPSSPGAAALGEVLTTAPQVCTIPQHMPSTENRSNNLRQVNVLDSSVIAARA